MIKSRCVAFKLFIVMQLWDKCCFQAFHCDAIATSDLHKTALGSSNPKYGNIARESHPAIYDGNRLLDPTHVPSSVWEIEETIALEVLVKEVKNFEKIFDELGDDYEQGVKNIKSLEITNRNLVREIECLTSDSIANDVFAIVRTADVRMALDAEISSSCVRELSKGLELEAEIAKKNKMLSESEKRCSHIEKDYIDLEIKFQEYIDCFESPNVL
uniref:Uncharacterized protein n=1 Tax=Tanacetum cinerariifolium TaxID=118510 RepID=A0A6L2KN80_TANCI|nr:hypothetical protein [Tanacetum cinerariifolium]